MCYFNAASRISTAKNLHLEGAAQRSNIPSNEFWKLSQNSSGDVISLITCSASEQRLLFRVFLSDRRLLASAGLALIRARLGHAPF